MHAEIIAVGTELTTGAKLDTNSQWLSLELAALGIPVLFHTTVADDPAANLVVFRNAAERADVVLISGGLGPTLDDLTREIMAKLAGVPLELHEPSLAIIKEMFARRNREMPERNVVQAMFPLGSEPIPNPRGTAPGVWMEVPRPGRPPCRLAALPGVPSEMKAMYFESVVPKLVALGAGGRIIRRARVNCFGLGESHCEQLLGDLTARGRDPEVGITVHEATITLRIEAHGATAEECQAKIAAARATAVERLGEYVFGDEDEELPDVVVARLRDAGRTLATAEIATGGLLAYWLHRAAERSARGTVYRGGSVGRPGAASHITDEAARLAAEARATSGADYGLAVSSIQDLPVAGAPAPHAAVALAGPGGVVTRELNVTGDPAILESRLAKSALNLLRLELLRL